jgi:hypothetical protein
VKVFPSINQVGGNMEFMLPEVNDRMKKHIMLSIIFLSLLIGYRIWIGMSLIDWINLTFLLGIIALAFTVTIKIWKTGFLSLFVEGFKVIGSTMVPRTRSAERADSLIKSDDSLNQWKNNMASLISYTFMNLSIISLTLSLIGLITFYQ